MVCRLFLSAIVLEEMTGLPIDWAVAAIGVTTIVYTVLGGMRAVLWTDLVQFVVYMGGAIAALAAILSRPAGRLGSVGGYSAFRHDKFRLFDLVTRPDTPAK